MTQQSMGELVTHLERGGYVERRVDSADRRARLVVVTDAGRAALAVAADRIRSIERTLAASLGDSGLAELRDALARVPEALSDAS
jgi:DNA-binding MarR family transcriptional regulator